MAVRLFAMAVHGLAGVTAQELRALGGRVTDRGFDGRSDVVLFELDDGALGRLGGLRTAEDVFVEVGRTFRSDGDRPRWIAERVWKPGRVERALAARRGYRAARPPRTVHVVARVLQERSFRRSDLRRELDRAATSGARGWRAADPADVEAWAIEYRPGRILAGLRLSDARMRRHGGRRVEREAALRPTVAAAMVMHAGRPHGLLLDPCCGSGTILAEAVAAGWRAAGSDIDEAAVRAARRNAPGAEVVRADARSIGRDDASVEACVSNLPFGKRYTVAGDPSAWTAAVLAELARVTRPGGRVVVLAPDVAAGALAPSLAAGREIPIRLLGTATAIRVYERR